MSVALLHEETAFLMFNEFRHACHLGGNHRDLAHHSLDQDVRNPVPVPVFSNQTREHKQACSWIQCRQLILSHSSRQEYPALQAQIDDHFFQFVVQCAVTDDLALKVKTAIRQNPACFYEKFQALFLAEARNTENERCFAITRRIFSARGAKSADINAMVSEVYRRMLIRQSS